MLLCLPIKPAVLDSGTTNQPQSACLSHGQHFVDMTARVDVSTKWAFDRHAEDVVLLSDGTVTAATAEHCALQ